ncbi:MAG: flagellar biosynthesis protein FliQ [Alphaproteobacteria bacterium]|jgi:flagellar biosynthetic protein FliQ|nr:flagellar biosynthesis protein FliQ [Alphaproteobacteria bacterium]MCZ6590752.1 flagellar biosynthesis protein FliQ [Alphaproteobacteria bacterium]MCZ6839749.1 flagellar biosynthesis protein FliQ [Alphaproteobacteria bacterium]MCZ6845494.1 flagellar biosynthesis protein FliQ [Alphaproteobacteria bacterium]
MEMAQVLDVSREAVIVLLKLAAPLMIMALVVGLVISLFQALTQIQEMTLAFVPKILVIFVSLLFFLPFMVTTLVTFTQGLASRIIGLS